jgi:two-component system sensor histidine kinase EvgS
MATNGRLNVMVLTDLTERKKAEADHEKLQAQLLQAQKMESVGRLAGGVAHDYNNMLSVIIGYAELAMGSLAPDDPLQDDLGEILTAARRSGDITRQLLAFARKQIISPRVLDLNETVENMLKMLRRLIGEDIDLAWLPGPGLGKVNLDPSQLDQILANLVVNARDAVTGVGTVTIETDNVRFDRDYCNDHPGFVPGDFVSLSVSDSGCGMAPEIQAQLFEPFFTTKKQGEGTGLGLATVYGIVKQNSGFINVYSEPGRGSTFRIYLPRHEGEAEDAAAPVDIPIPGGRGETVLVVEDEPSVLKLARKVLEQTGYTVLTADSPDLALALARDHAGTIHLLVTDVVMPGMDGRDLAHRIASGHPEIKILFMSGYTANVIAHRGVLDRGVNFIQKPFSKQELAVRVRRVLDAEAGSDT